MKKIYIGGPMTGLPQFNYPAFFAEAVRLRALGYEVLNPAENPDPPCKSWAGYMRLSIAQIVQCDTLALLPGWKRSKGTRVERWIARILGMRIVRMQQSGRRASLHEHQTRRLQHGGAD